MTYHLEPDPLADVPSDCLPWRCPDCGLWTDEDVCPECAPEPEHDDEPLCPICRGSGDVGYYEPLKCGVQRQRDC